jgi:LPXTG-motif cell wall-anchored protein
MVDTSAPTSVGQSGFAGVASSSLIIMIALSLAAAALALFAYQRRKNTV